MMDIEKRRIQIEIKRILYFGRIVGPWWRPSLDATEINERFANFLQCQQSEDDPILRAAFTCLVFEKNRLIAFIPHNSPPFALLKSDKVALSEAEAAVVKQLYPTYDRPIMPYFSSYLNLSETLRPKTVGKMMLWCVEEL